TLATEGFAQAGSIKRTQASAHGRFRDVPSVLDEVTTDLSGPHRRRQGAQSAKHGDVDVVLSILGTHLHLLAITTPAVALMSIHEERLSSLTNNSRLLNDGTHDQRRSPQEEPHEHRRRIP